MIAFKSIQVISLEEPSENIHWSVVVKERILVRRTRIARAKIREASALLARPIVTHLGTEYIGIKPPLSY